MTKKFFSKENFETIGRSIADAASNIIRILKGNKKRSIITAILLVVVAAILVIYFSSGGKNITGTYYLDEYTAYDFQPDGRGTLIAGNMSYGFSYYTKGKTLKLDFDSDAVYNAEYQYELHEGKLILVGGEGTVGGKYELEP